MVKTIVLENGIRVVMEPMTHLRTVSFGVWVGVGSAHETRENNGISHVIEHCLFKGTKTRTAKQLADEISAIGDQLNAFTGKECTAFYGVTLAEFLPRLMELLGDMLLNSTFEEEPLKKELGVILEEIDMYDDSPEDLVHELLQKNVWKNHPLGFIISGEKSVVKAMTKEQIVAFMAEHYYGSNMVISIAGNYKEEEFLSDVKRYFGAIPKYGTNTAAEVSGKLAGKLKNTFSNGSKPLPDVPYEKKFHRQDTPEVPVFHRCFCKREKDVEQLYMNLAFDTVSERDDARHTMIVTNAVLGGSNNSRLFQKIREESGLAYSVYSYSSMYRYAGLFHIDVIVNPANALLVYDTLKEILQEFRSTKIGEPELAALSTQLRTEMIMGSESARNRMEHNAKSLLMHDRIVPLEETIERLSQVTADDILSFARQYLDMKTCSICLVGDIKESETKIKERWQC
ncbi:MAG: M16 family metallopeptidase [Lachnospiraceae bacterium]